MLEFLDQSYGPLKVWQEPEAGRRYVIGVDSAEGKVRDKASSGRHVDTAMSARDYSSASVIDARNGALVASWHGSIDTHKYAIVIHNLGMWYNQALVAVEVTGTGRAVQDNLTAWEYPNCWVVRKPQFADSSPGDNVEFGWKTTAVTRPLLIQSVHQVLGLDLDIVLAMIPDEDLIKEMVTMEVDDQGKPRGIGKNKDDRVFSFAIATRVRQEDLELNAPEVAEERYKGIPAGDRWVWKRLDEEIGNEEDVPGKMQDIEELEYAD